MFEQRWKRFNCACHAVLTLTHPPTRSPLNQLSGWGGGDCIGLDGANQNEMDWMGLHWSDILLCSGLEGTGSDWRGLEIKHHK